MVEIKVMDIFGRLIITSAVKRKRIQKEIITHLSVINYTPNNIIFLIESTNNNIKTVYFKYAFNGIFLQSTVNKS